VLPSPVPAVTPTGNLMRRFCGNWFAQMANTAQPLFPNASCTKDVRGGATMPWCTCMVGKGGC
jgi:hypothetical protein